MMKRRIRCPRLWLLGLVTVSLVVLALPSAAFAQTTRNKATHASEPLYSDYKGVRVGMAAEEVHKLLGKPVQTVDDQEFYIISESETVQICYKTGKVCTISVDYMGQVSNIPDYKTVIGDSIETRPDGSMWKLVRYEKAGFWVSYNRTTGTVPMTTITIQKME